MSARNEYGYPIIPIRVIYRIVVPPYTWKDHLFRGMVFGFVVGVCYLAGKIILATWR